MSVNKALDNILAGKLDEMRSNFSSALSTKAVEKLEERKIEIAQQYFGQVQEEKKNPSQKLSDLDAKRREFAKKVTDPNSETFRQRKLKDQDDRIQRMGRTIASKAKSY
jgi:flagellar biosynthesis chaperone FliJ